MNESLDCSSGVKLVDNTVNPKEHKLDLIVSNNRFVVMNELSDGIGSKVYQARDTTLNSVVILKEICLVPGTKLDVLDSLRHVLSKSSKINNPRLSVPEYIYHEDIDGENINERSMVCPGSYFIVSEFKHGMSLFEWRKLFIDSKVNVNKAIEICLDIASILDSTHSENAVHGSLSFGNIIIDSANNVNIINFSTGSEIIRSVTDPSFSVHNRSLQSTTAPEQLVSNISTAQCDQYSLAVIFYNLITGLELFENFSKMKYNEQRNTILHQKPIMPNELSVDQWDVLNKSLAKDPNMRYGTCYEMVNILTSDVTQKILTSVQSKKMNYIKKRKSYIGLKQDIRKYVYYGIMCFAAYYCYMNHVALRRNILSLVSEIKMRSNRYSDYSTKTNPNIHRNPDFQKSDEDGILDFLKRLINGDSPMGDAQRNDDIAFSSEFNQAIDKFDAAEEMVRRGDGIKALNEMKAVHKILLGLKSKTSVTWKKNALNYKISECEGCIEDLEELFGL